MTPRRRLLLAISYPCVGALRALARLSDPALARVVGGCVRAAGRLGMPATLTADLDDLRRAFAERPRQARIVRQTLEAALPGELEELVAGALARRRPGPPPSLAARPVAAATRGEHEAPAPPVDLTDVQAGDGTHALPHLRAGQDVWVSFPPAEDRASAKALLEAAHASGRRVHPRWSLGSDPRVAATRTLLAGDAIGRINGVRIGVVLGRGASLAGGVASWFEPLALALELLGPIAEIEGRRPVPRDGWLPPTVVRWRHARPACLGVLDLTHAPELALARGTREVRLEITGTDGIVSLDGLDGASASGASLRLYRGEERHDLTFAVGRDGRESGLAASATLPAERTWALSLELLGWVERLGP